MELLIDSMTNIPSADPLYKQRRSISKKATMNMRQMVEGGI